MALSPPPPSLTPQQVTHNHGLDKLENSDPIIQKRLCHQPERFTTHFVDIVKQLWPPISPYSEDLSGLPKNGEEKPYREEQLEQLSARVHKDLRRMKQAQPGHANYEFLNILQMCLQVKNKSMETTDEARKVVQLLKSKLRKSVCIKSISSKTQDSRIQIEKWEAPSPKFPNGKAKKVYLHWELYNLFNVIDEGRYDRTKQKIKHTQLFRPYCSKEKTLMCLNPCHYEAVMDHAKFNDAILKLVENYRSQNMDPILNSKEKYTCLNIWTRDVHKYIEWSSTCSPARFLDIIESRLDNKQSNSIGSLSKKLQNFGFGRQACIYYTQRTPRDKIKELESRLVEFCRPEVHRKLQQGDKNERVIRWSCDDKNTQRYCCNPDHVDSYCPNIVANTGRHVMAAMFNRTFKHTSQQNKKIEHQSEEPSKWCHISFNRCK